MRMWNQILWFLVKLFLVEFCLCQLFFVMTRSCWPLNQEHCRNECFANRWKGSLKDYQGNDSCHRRVERQALERIFNPSGLGSWMLVEGEGVLNQPIPSRSPRTTVKKQNKFDILKVYNELGKVKTYETFSWRNDCLKNVWAESAPPCPIRINVNWSWFLDKYS